MSPACILMPKAGGSLSLSHPSPKLFSQFLPQPTGEILHQNTGPLGQWLSALGADIRLSPLGFLCLRAVHTDLKSFNRVLSVRVLPPLSAECGDALYPAVSPAWGTAF